MLEKDGRTVRLQLRRGAKTFDVSLKLRKLIWLRRKLLTLALSYASFCGKGRRLWKRRLTPVGESGKLGQQWTRPKGKQPKTHYGFSPRARATAPHSGNTRSRRLCERLALRGEAGALFVLAEGFGHLAQPLIGQRKHGAVLKAPR